MKKKLKISFSILSAVFVSEKGVKIYQWIEYVLWVLITPFVATKS